MYLSLFKIFNFIKISLSYFISKTLGKPILFGLPIAASFEPTTACNLGCPECPSGLKQFTRPEGNAKMSSFEKFIALNKKNLLNINFYFQGEPFINKNLLEMISLANKNKIHTSTSTNGHFINEKNADKIIQSGLKKIIFSVDGYTQETYQKYRKDGDLSKVINGINQIVKAKTKSKSYYPKVYLQFLVVNHNEHEINDIKKLSKSLKVDKTTFKTAQIYDYKNGNPLIPSNEKYSRYKKQKNGTYKIKNPLKNECWRMWTSFVSTWDGDIIPCCFDKDGKYKMGNISNVVYFNQIWKSKTYQNFRSQILLNRNKIDICTNCTEGTKTFQ